MPGAHRTSAPHTVIYNNPGYINTHFKLSGLPDRILVLFLAMHSSKPDPHNFTPVVSTPWGYHVSGIATSTLVGIRSFECFKVLESR